MPTSDIKKGPLYVDSTNNRVGIGTSSPSEALEVHGTTPILQINDRGLYQAQFGLIGNDLEIRGSSGNVEFYTGSADGASSTERLRIDSSGNLLVGTTSGTFGGSGRGLIELNGSSDSLLSLKHGDTAGLYLYTASGEGRVAQFANLPMTFFTNNTERMRIDSSGRVTMPYQPSFRSRGSNQNYIQTSPIPFPTVLHNIGSHYNSSTYTFTAPIAGRYLFHVNLGITNGSTNAYAYPTLNVNGVGQFYTYFQIASTWYGNNHLTAILDLSVNDYVNVSFNGTGTYYNGGSECQFFGHLLG